MQIAFQPFSLALRHPWAVSGRTGSRARTTVDTVLVELRDDTGCRGLGEAPTTRRYHQDVDAVVAFLRRVEPSRLRFDDLSASLDYLHGLDPANASARCAVETALLDGGARSRGQRLCDFFGLGFTEGRHRTTLSIGIDSPEMIRTKVLEAAPFQRLKMKVGDPGDADHLAALRSAAPRKTVRVDANEAWVTPEEALRHLESLAADGNIEFVEQPMPADTPSQQLRWLKARSPLPLFADESYHSAVDAERCAECFHGVNVKLIKTAGVGGARAALEAARKAGLKTMIGCMIETSILITAAAHLAELADHLDLDGNLLVTNDPCRGATVNNGILSLAAAPERFGLGVRPVEPLFDGPWPGQASDALVPA